MKAVGAVPFRVSLDGMPEIGQGVGWTKRQWRNAPLCWVQLADLISINRGGYLNEARVRRYMRRPGHAAVCVVAARGCLYVADGHHRATAAYRRGEQRIQARVMRC